MRKLKLFYWTDGGYEPWQKFAVAFTADDARKKIANDQIDRAWCKKLVPVEAAAYRARVRASTAQALADEPQVFPIGRNGSKGFNL